MSRPQMYDIDPYVFHSIIRNSKIPQTELGKKLGYSKGYLSVCMSQRRVPVSVVDLAWHKLRIDFSPAIIKNEDTIEEKPAEVVEEKQEPDPAMLKIIEEYSYVRSNDIDRLIQSIDRLTETIKEVWK